MLLEKVAFIYIKKGVCAMPTEKKSMRAHFVDLLKERGITPQDMQKFRQIGDLIHLAKERTKAGCTGTGDSCEPGQDCGYKEGGCGSDECCNWCDSCMVTWDTCGSKQTCPNGG